MSRESFYPLWLILLSPLIVLCLVPVFIVWAGFILIDRIATRLPI